MRAGEVRAVGTLAGGALGGTVSLVHDMHRSIARRCFDSVGPGGAPARLLHDGISRAAYRGVGGMLSAVPRLAAATAARARPGDAPSLADTPAGSAAVAALNGVMGDALEDEASALSLPMALRHRGEVIAVEDGRIEVDSEALARAHPDAGARVAVLIHGLCETDDSWRLRPLSSERWPDPDYGSRLARDLGYTPLYLRYNTGLHISDNGRRLARLLEAVCAGWPAEVEELVLVGHSMGGLVARSACHYASAERAAWARRVRHVFCLGSPHLGAPLEKAANVAGHALALLPETRAMAGIFNGRSAGIKDLRFGSCAEEDWCDCDPDELLTDRCTDVPFLPDSAYYFVGATVTRSERHPAGYLVGDLLVRYPSASGAGRDRRIPFQLDKGRHLGGLNHFQLLNHPAVYEQIRAWIAR